MIHPLRCAALACAALFLSCGAQADSSAADKQAAVDALFADYDHVTTPGVALSIYQGGHEVYARGYGMADLETGTVNTPRTVFHVASVSKQFTAFSILLLARDGKLKLDDDIRKYLPYVPDFGHKITINHLIHHTSGLRDQWMLFELGGVEDGSRRRQTQVVNMVARQRALNSLPGTEFNYCNTGYTLLAEIVKAVSGQTLRQFTTERIFKPLHMDRMFFYDDATEVVPERAQSYDKNDSGGWSREILSLSTVGATSLHTTASDFAKWANNFARPTVGDKALIDQFTTMGRLDDGAPINYGFALIRKKVFGHEAVMHSGSDAGYRSIFTYFPKEDFAVAILANTPMDNEKLMQRIVEIYLGKQAGDSLKPVPAAVAGDEWTSALPGKYQDPASRDDTDIVITDGKVGIEGWRGEFKPLVFRADGTFDTGDEDRAKGRFYRAVRDAKGEVRAIEDGAAGDYGRVSRYLRIKPVDTAQVNLRELVGDYRSVELDATYTLSVKDGELLVNSVWFDRPLPLKPLVKDGFTAPWPIGYVEVKRGAGGRPAALLLTTSRARNVRFDRVP